MKPPIRTIELRKQNRENILRMLFLQGPMSRLEISQRAGISPGTVTNVTSELIQEGLLRETGLVESEGGRPRTILAVDPGYGCLAGVDMGETEIQLELFDLGWQKLAAVRRGVAPTNCSPTDYVELIASALDEATRLAGIQPDCLLGLGVGVPGVVEHERDLMVVAPMWGWKGVGFLALLQERIACPVYVDNGAKGMALAEAWFGGGRGVQDSAVVLIGTGIGSGMITKGALYRGATNSAGEWGHTKIVLDGRPCRCGSRGCLEAYAGAPGIIAGYRELSGLSGSAETADQHAAIAEILEAARRGDPVAAQTLHATAHYLGAALANIVNLFNPGRIVIGGWVGLLLGGIILDDLQVFLARYALPPSLTHLDIRLCELGEDAICRGAACLVLEEFLSGNTKFSRRNGVQPVVQA